MVDSSVFGRLTRSPGPWWPVRHPGHVAVRHCRSVAAPSRPVGQDLVPTVLTGVAAADRIALRAAGPQELPAAREMHGRCSPETLAARYHGPPGDADRYLAHLLSPRHGRSLAAWTEDGRLVALGHLLWDGEEAEVALLVEDDWQRRGLGSALLRRLLAMAAQAGLRTAYAVAQSGNSAMLRTMRSTGLPLSCDRSEGTVVITVPLAPRPSPPVLSGPAAAG